MASKLKAEARAVLASFGYGDNWVERGMLDSGHWQRHEFTALQDLAAILASRDAVAEARVAKAERERYKPFFYACLRLSNMLEGFVMGNVDDGELEAARLEVEAEADKLAPAVDPGPHVAAAEPLSLEQPEPCSECRGHGEVGKALPGAPYFIKFGCQHCGGSGEEPR